jgi:hypothetical protein
MKRTRIGKTLLPKRDWNSAAPIGKRRAQSGYPSWDQEQMRLQTQAWVIRKENDARAGTRVKDMLYGLPSKKRMASQRKAGRRA